MIASGRLAFVLALTILALAGCEETAEGPVITSPYYPGLSSIAPPAPVFEEPAVLDSPRTELWRPGYWSYDGSNFEWVSGEVMAKPAPTAAWFPAYWTRHTYGWAFVPGHWE